MRSRIAAVLALFTLALGATGGASAVTAPRDRVRAVNVMPPGESGMISLGQFVEAQADGNYGAHATDQAPLYSAFHYKPDQFGKGALWRTMDGATIYRDAWGVPQIYASNRAALFRAFGYSMAADRLFQMEIFRRVGHGTLAALLGPKYLPMDEEVRRVSEGPNGRAAELAKSDPQTRADLQAFADGINGYIDEASVDPQKLPAEFILLADVPIAAWTMDDTLAFGEYAGRFFGEFGHGELETAATLARLTPKVGSARAHKIVNDLYPLEDPKAITTIPKSLGRFPRHVAPNGTGHAVPVNDTVASVGGARAVLRANAARANIMSTVTGLQRRLGVTGFGSNQYIVTASHSATGHPLLVSEPQTSLAIPSFFWEAEIHGGGFDVRGVTVPALPLLVIGRNATSGWAVTSGLDGNSDTYAERLSTDGKSYLYNGRYVPIRAHDETIECRTPPTAVLDLTEGDTSSICTAPSETLTVRHTIHGPLIAPPDVGARVAYSRKSVVDGRIVSSLRAWTLTTQARTVNQYAQAASRVAFSFNFMYVNAENDAAYYHVGRYPIRPADVDPRFPIPGTGAWEWRGFERFSDQPHSVNPSSGFLANWNNKPAAGWYSKPNISGSIPPEPNPVRPSATVWGPTNQVEAIQWALAGLIPRVRFADMAHIEKHVASVDSRARTWMPSLLAAIEASKDPSLSRARAMLAGWNRMRRDLNHDGKYDAPGLVIFDRWAEVALKKSFAVLDPTTFQVSSGVRDDGHYFSSDNEDTPSFKSDDGLYGTFTHLLRGETRYDYFGSSSKNAVLVSALREALKSLKTQLGADMSTWREADEREPYPAQGAAAVDDVSPTLNRGSYGQIIEAGGAPASKILIAP